MAWTSTSVSAEQSAGAVDYWKYRPLKGNVEMRLTEVTCANDMQWLNPARVYVTLIDASGNVLANDVELRKDWGVLPGYTHLTNVPPGRSVRFRVRTNIQVWNEGAMWALWRADLRWDSSNAF